MSDLVKRLREREKFAREEITATSLGDALHFEEAADRIEALEAALREISDLRYRDMDGGMMAYAMSRVARTALAPKQDK